MEIVIRDAKPDDVKDIQKVFHKTWLSTYPNSDIGVTKEDIEEVFKSSYDEEKLFNFSENIKNINPNSKFFVAEVDKKVVGVCRIFIRENFNQLQSIYVLPEFQGKGIGKMLWENCLNFFDKNKNILVQVAIYNSNAIKFYESLGFKDNGERSSEERFRMPISKVLIPEMGMEIKRASK